MREGGHESQLIAGFAVVAANQFMINAFGSTDGNSTEVSTSTTKRATGTLASLSDY